MCHLIKIDRPVWGAGREGRTLPFVIRRMLPEDIPAVVAIEKQSNPSPWTAEQFRNELDNPCAAIDLVTVHVQLAAFVCSWRILDELQILNVATAPRYRLKGYAGKLLDYVFRQAADVGARKVLLEVRVGNEAARKLYEKMHFSVSGVRESYYRDGEDASLMELELDEYLSPRR